MYTFILDYKTNQLQISINEIIGLDFIFNSKELIINLLDFSVYNFQFTNIYSLFLPTTDIIYAKLANVGMNLLYNCLTNICSFNLNSLEHSFCKSSSFIFIPNNNIISDIKINTNILNEIFNILSNSSFLVYLISILFILLFLWCIISSVGMSGLISIAFITIVLPNLNKITKFLFFLFSLFETCSAAELAVKNLELMYHILAIGGFPLYMLIYFAFDYVTLNFLMNKKMLEKDLVLFKRATRMLYVCLINLGIFHTDSIWYFFPTGPEFPLWCIIATLVNVFSSFLYNTIQRWIDLENGNSRSYNIEFSFCRAIIDYISFSSICYSTFWILRLLTSYQMPYFNLISFILGLIFYTPIMFFVIRYETIGSDRILYGILYNLSFTFMVISSNGLWFLYSPYILNHLYIGVGAIILGNVLVYLLAPDIYRIRLGNRSNRQILFEVIMYYLLVNSYVLCTNITWTYLTDPTLILI